MVDSVWVAGVEGNILLDKRFCREIGIVSRDHLRDASYKPDDEGCRAAALGEGGEHWGLGYIALAR